MRRFRIRRRRALAIVLAPAAALTFGFTTADAAEQRQAVIDPAKGAVRYGERVNLRGRFPGAPNATVALQYRSAGKRGASARWRRAARTSTAAGPRG